MPPNKVNPRPTTTNQQQAKPTPTAGRPQVKPPAPVKSSAPSTPTRTAQRNAQAKDFGDESVKGGFNERPEAFRGKAGMTYVIRFVTLPVAYFGSYVQNKSDPSKSFFMQSRADYADSEAAYNGDQEAEARASEQCPLWERKEKIQQKFVAGIFLVGKEDSKGRFEKVGAFYPWSFGGERYASLTNICRSLPTKPDGSRLSIKAVEIRAQCTDDKYQKFNLAAVTTASQIKMKWDAVWDEVKGYFEGDSTTPCDKIEEFLKPDSKRDMIASLDRAHGKSQDAVEEVDDAPPARQGKHADAKLPARRAPDPDPEDTGENGDPVGDALESALEGLTDDGSSSDEGELEDVV